MKREFVNRGSVYLILGLTLLYSSCVPDYPDGYLERIKAYEDNWNNCYDENFNFPKNDSILGKEYLVCNLDTKDVLINDGYDEFEGRVMYEFSWTTSQPNTTLPWTGKSVNKLHICFALDGVIKQIALVVKYPTDSLNYTIQKLFSHPEIICSSNFIEDSLDFQVELACFPDGSVKFSTLFSLIADQLITVDSFSSILKEGIWNYHLEYSFDECEITNEALNESNKINMFGRKRKSDIQIENLIVKNLRCVIDFELPEG